MRAAWTLTTTCAIFVLKSAASTTAGGDQTDRRAFDLVTGAPRHEAHASAAPNILEAHDSASAANKIDHGLSNDEERGGHVPPETVEAMGTTLLPSLKHVSEALEETGVQLRHPLDGHEMELEGLLAKPLTDFVKAGDQEKHPLAALNNINVGVERKVRDVGPELSQWIQLADRYHSPSHTFGDTAIVDSLLTKFGGDSQRLVNFFDWLQVFGNQKDRAIELQRVLRDKLSLEMITPMWLKARSDHDDVYHMMPIGERPRLTPGDEAEAAWPAILADSIDWLEYVDKSYALGSSADAFKKLVKFRGEEEVLRLSTSLPLRMKHYADKFQAKLYDKFADMRPRLIDMWIESGTTPVEAYDLMSIELNWIRLNDRRHSKKRVLCRNRVVEWVCFNDEFMARSFLFSRDERKIKLRNELREAIDSVPMHGATAAQEKEKEEAMEKLLEDKAISMLMEVEPLASMSKDKALVKLLDDETTAKRWLEHVVYERLLAAKVPDEQAKSIFYNSIMDQARWHRGVATIDVLHARRV